MDEENLLKWKEEFQTERKKQAYRVRGLQKETVMRRKAMEMKAQIEAAKEEKRRKEALAERKAQHIEATMRFQKGIKNFKLKKDNTDKISLDDVLKQMSPARSRLNSAESDRTRFQHSELANYYCVNKRPLSCVKRSSSFESINTPKSAPGNYRLNNFNIEQFNSTAPSQFSPSFHQAINENQKQIHEMNREALREFQNLIKTEVSNQTRVEPNHANNFSSYASNFVYPIHQKFTNILPQNEIKKESETYSDVGTIITVDDANSDEERDSLDTDSLLNARIESPDFAKLTSDQQTREENTIIPIKTETNFNSYFNVKSKPQAPPVVRQAVASNSSGNVSRKASNQIRGILKRSSSLDNSSLVINSVTKNATCFKSEKVIKDSIDLANTRLNGSSNDTESSRKKSVRFAHDQEVGMITEPVKIKQENTSQVNTSNSNSNTRISSTNSIRRPIIKPRNTSQTKAQITDLTSDSKNLINENSKPPLPNGQSGYSVLNQKRREFFQRNRLLNDKQIVKSPKSTKSPSPVQIQDTNSNFVFDKPQDSKNITLNDRVFRQVVYNFQDGRAMQTAPSPITLNSPNRIKDKNLKELQINMIKNELELNLNDSSNGSMPMPRNNYQNITQHFYQKNLNSTQEKDAALANGSDQNGLRRHFGFLPNSRQTQDNSVTRLAFLNSIQQPKNNLAPRVLSAESLNKNQNQTNQLDIKYPLYSNYQAQNNQYTVKKIHPNLTQEQPQSAKDVLDSMALFLKAEDMSNRNYSESQIINTVHNNAPKNATNYLEQNMTNLSLEEQRIKNSLMRLDERYNFLKTHHQTRFNNEEMNGRRFNVMNKYQRPMSTNVIRYRK